MRCAPPESAAVLTERRNGKARSTMLAAKGAISSPVLAARAILGQYLALERYWKLTDEEVQSCLRSARDSGDQP